MFDDDDTSLRSVVSGDKVGLVVYHISGRIVHVRVFNDQPCVCVCDQLRFDTKMA